LLNNLEEGSDGSSIVIVQQFEEGNSMDDSKSIHEVRNLIVISEYTDEEINS